MNWLKWIIGVPLALLFLVFAHYTLPGRDVVRIVGTDVKRMDIGSSSWFWAAPDAGTNPNWTRDVRFINAVWPNGDPRVYRNEDTDWGWPPYFKFDSSNVTAQAQDLTRQEGKTWVAITHYGWRIKLFTIFPNVISIKEVSGPNIFLIPWFNIVFLLLVAAVIITFLRTVLALKRRQVDPIVDKVDDMIDDVNESAGQATDTARRHASTATSGFRRWLKRWFG
ncbi:MAG: DUF1523 family protein [Roseibium sp.]